jgi:hypothetical protein
VIENRASSFWVIILPANLEGTKLAKRPFGIERDETRSFGIDSDPYFSFEQDLAKVAIFQKVNFPNNNLNGQLLNETCKASFFKSG